MTKTLTLTTQTLDSTIAYMKELIRKKPSESFVVHVTDLEDEESVSPEHLSAIRKKLNNFEQGKADVISLDAYMNQKLCIK